MRRAATYLLATVLLLAACGDPGLRDRSLMAKGAFALDAAAAAASRRPVKGSKPAPSVIGLVPDTLAPYYPDGAPLVLRFEDRTALQREALPELRAVAAQLPGLALPTDGVEVVLRKLLDLPESVTIDAQRPFALIPTPLGWAAILPTRSHEEAGGRMKPLDGVYCVAGDPEVVAAYEPGFRKGFCLPGDLSVVVAPEAVPRIGTLLTEACGALGPDFRWLDGCLGPLPTDIERVDFAVRVGQGGLRADLRLAPNRESPTAFYLEKMKPASSDAARWLPSNGTLYAELTARPLDWEGLFLNLARDLIPAPKLARSPELAALRGLLAAFGRDVSVMLDLTPEGLGTILLVADLDEVAATQAYFGSPEFARLLELIAGPGGQLDWKPDAFDRNGVSVGAITGNISRSRLQEWRGEGVLASTLSVLLRGPVICYVTTVSDKLCIVVGQTARPETERFIDHLRNGRASDNDHNLEAATLFPYRLAAASVDLAALFDGCREAAPYWHPQGRALKPLSLRWRLPASIAVTIEGGALRCAVRVRSAQLAEATAKIGAALASDK